MSGQVLGRAGLLLVVATQLVGMRGRSVLPGLLVELARRLSCSGPVPRAARVHCMTGVVALLLLAGGADVAAQSGADTVRVTLPAAVARALSGSEQVAIAEAGVLRARGDRYQSRAGFLPKLSSSIGYTRTLESEYQSLRMPAGDTAGENPFEGLELPFGQANRYELGVSATQTLFAGGQLLAQHRIAGAGERTAGIALAGARAQLELDVTRAYFDAALSDRLLHIAAASLEQAEGTLRQVSAASRVGDKAEFEVLRAQVARDNLRPQVISRRADRDLAYMRLKQLLELPLEHELQLDTPLPLTEDLVAAATARGKGSAGEPAGDVVVSPDTTVTRRGAVRQAAEAVVVRENLAKIAFAQRLPSVGLTTQYGRVGYPRAGLPDWDQFRANWTVGLQLQLPVFTGGRIRGEELKAQADVAEAKARLAQTRELAALDGRSALEKLEAAGAAWEASAGTVEQAARAYRIAELRYREGLSTQLELADARLMLQQAEANRAVAGRDLEVARAVVRLLPDLPIGSAQQGR